MRLQTATASDYASASHVKVDDHTAFIRLFHGAAGLQLLLAGHTEPGWVRRGKLLDTKLL